MNREQQLEEAVKEALKIMDTESFSMVKRMRRARETLAFTLGALGEVSLQSARTREEENSAEIVALTIERDMLRNRLMVIGRDAMSAVNETKPRKETP